LEGRIITIDVDGLWTYKTADWNNKAQVVNKGEAFTIVDKINVSGSFMYKLKSGLYITANEHYVTLK
jgi:N-acetylmuramoyl-L-alanine amidase